MKRSIARSYRHTALQWACIPFMLFAVNLGFSQDDTERVRDQILVESDTTLIDTLAIVPGSFQASFRGDTLTEGIDFKLLYARGALVRIGDWTGNVACRYRVFPEKLDFTVEHKILPERFSEAPSPFDPSTYTTNAPRLNASPFSEESLQRTGSISRGIAFGNTQNLAVNSSLNLQLSGKLNSRFRVLAAITDDNVPIQPDGNTRQIQEFDRVYIQLYDDKTRLTAGDFQMGRRDNRFLHYSKRAQGARVTSVWSPVGDLNKRAVEIEASGAISKGRFARNRIQGIEGNQGPYRLTGDEGETFITVLAGTEQVYIDGVLLERGEGEDYVINYNTAEIRFTPRQLITKDKRIVVDFQYATFSYARSLLQGRVSSKSQKWSWYAEGYNEQDAKNQSLQQDLSATDRLTLLEAGDDPLNAIVSGIDSTGFDADQVRYALVDTLGFEAFVVSNDAEVALYQLSFSTVGQGNGDYISGDFTANGKTFDWVAPEIVNGDTIHQGDHDPVILLDAPELRRMLIAGGSWSPSDKTLVTSEFAFSQTDLNTFSEIDNNDNQGFAGALTLSHRLPLSSDSTGWNLQLGAGQELTNSNFRGIERFRPAEFQRDWNIPTTQLINESSISNIDVGLTHPQTGVFVAGADRFTSNNYEGNKAALDAQLQRKGWSLTGTASLLDAVREGQSSTFNRHRIDARKSWKHLSIGFADEFEDNRFFLGETDSLGAASYRFLDWQAYIAQGDSARNQFRVFYRERKDETPSNNNLAFGALARNYGLSTTITTIKNQRIALNLSQRVLEVGDENLLNISPEETVLGRLEHNARFGRGFLTHQAFYETGSGLELRREFVYLEVPAGQGVYVWNDYNGDGIRDLNEFEIAAFGYEANYIRSAIPSNDYVKVFTNQVSEVLQLNPSSLWSGDEGWKGWVSRFSALLSYRGDRKTSEDGEEFRYNPLPVDVPDSLLLSLTQTTRGTLFFNRSNPKFSADLTRQNNRSRSLLTNGIEGRSDEFTEGNVRTLLRDEWVMNVRLKDGFKTSSADFLSGRNYSINYFDAEPRLTWQQGTRLQVSVSYQYTDKQNRGSEGDGEFSTINRLGGEARVSNPGKGSLAANFNLIEIEFEGEANSALGFELLDGLQAGRNLTWGANWQYFVTKNVQLNLIYDGRTSEGDPAIHRGSVQARAFF